MQKDAEKKIRGLVSEHTEPPLSVIIPILEKKGSSGQELTIEVYNSTCTLIKGVKEILGLEERSMKTLAQGVELVMSITGQKFQPHELSESRYSFSILECPMTHVGKDVNFQVKSKYCDAICCGRSRAIIDTVLGSGTATCSWDKGLLKGANKCTKVIELVKTR